MKNKLLGVVFASIVSLPLPLFAEQTDCLDNPCAEAVTEDSCRSCGGSWNSGGSCSFSCGGTSITTCAEGSTASECTSHEVTSEGESGTSHYQGGGSTNSSTGSGGEHYTHNNVTDTGNAEEDNHQPGVAETAALECTGSVYLYNNSNDRMLPLYSPPVETSDSDIAACEEYGECIREMYASGGFVSFNERGYCAQATVCKDEWRNNVTALSDASTTVLSFIDDMKEQGKYLLGFSSSIYLIEDLAQENYCDCMDKFGFGKLVQTTCK